MRIAVLSDIHANREAFEAVLADAGARGFDRLVLLGDVVGYGPDPGWCADRAAALVAAGAVCLKGNHDHAASGGVEPMNRIATEAITWTKAQLGAGQMSFLRDLPMAAEMGEVLFVHASADDPAAWHYVMSPSDAVASFRGSQSRVILCGHVHMPLLVSADADCKAREESIPMGRPVSLGTGRRWLAVIGSVGQPRDDVPEAGYALLDMAADTLTFRRVAYDMEPTVAKIRAAGLPEQLALRLMWGQ